MIASPSKSSEFSKIIQSLTDGSTPDAYTISIDDTLNAFDELEPLYIAHYMQKKPDISNESLDKLTRKTSNKSRVLKEATNSISAGIFISHGHSSIYGSDVHDWEKYASCVKKLPELRLPVESFEHFCLLIEKDTTAINTLLDQKTPENLTLTPFEDDTVVKLKVYNDINILFGSKGTGKSRILADISRHYAEKGIGSAVFEAGNDSLADKYDIKGKNITKNLNHLGINYCTDQISNIKNAKEYDVTSMFNYVEFFRSESRNTNAIKILLKDIRPQGEVEPKRKFDEHSGSLVKLKEMMDFLNDDEPILEVAAKGQLEHINDELRSIGDKLTKARWGHFVEWKSRCLLNSAIKKFGTEVAKKTGSLTKPFTTGFTQYAQNRVQIELDAKEILKNIRIEIKKEVDTIGTLGLDKGILECATSYIFQDGRVTDSKFTPVKNVKKTPQKQFSSTVQKIAKDSHSDSLFEHVASLNAIDDIDDIETVYELLLFSRRFEINGTEYEPSTGESSMLNLHAELEEEKEVYILDEPEKSLGNEYINDVIIPLINEKARLGKKVFISTHDANIAVRTLPYNSIYRCHGREGYTTYVGNPFSNHLVNIANGGDKLDWKKISMKTLEGGEIAFGERGKIYGNT